MDADRERERRLLGGEIEERQDPGGLDLGRRASPRLSSVYSAKLAQRGKVQACVVTNLSLTGGRVKLTQPVDVHAPMRLMFDRLGDYWALNVGVVWSASGMVGVRLFDAEETRRATLQRLMPGRFKRMNFPRDKEKEG
ncbi:PilZ domain-containing protein [Varunaivibrio sulfuroxidans]|uniref:PilZ domain-containing protein n=1 Tax=Varunaivibrio sulfuroxidans TaxID=1773489 RepID=A0A4R3JDU9_9PROT|nr:PilZ domain-containing protein [Varunaivibrio sulfuroxidans]TCS64022.1 PilZ domain-containing protein [Varunaivibrio sulfuroxidans]WES31525.1 PilZ domain-containing protein [Varunaivibrio sulfuroxidans]